MRPTLLDWTLLVYFLLLFASPLLISNGVAVGPSVLFLKLFPSGFFLVALALIILKSLIPSCQPEFGLPGARWGAIIAVLAMIFVFLGSFSLIVPVATGGSVEVGHWAEIDFVAALPVTFVLCCGVFVVVSFFSGCSLGPTRKKDEV